MWLILQKNLKEFYLLKDFLYASDNTLIKDIYRKDSISVFDNEEAESVASKMKNRILS